MISLLLNAENYACFTLRYGPTHACSDVNREVIAVEDNAESLLLKISELAPILCQEAHDAKELRKAM